MSEIDEGLDEILCEEIPRLVASGAALDRPRQAIKELFCKHRGCEQPVTFEIIKRDKAGCPTKGKYVTGPCKWCEKEQP